MSSSMRKGGMIFGAARCDRSVLMSQHGRWRKTASRCPHRWYGVWMWPLLRLLGYSLLLSSRTTLFTWSSGTTKAPNKRVAPVSVGHSNPSPDGPRAPTQEPSKDKEERLCKGTYIGLKRKFNEGGRFQDWLSLFFCFCRLTFLCRWYVMVTCYWVPFTSWYASSCPVGALLARLEARCVERYYVGRRLVA